MSNNWLNLNNNIKINLQDFNGEIATDKLSNDFKEIINVFDANNDGKISSSEIKTLWQNLKQGADKNQNSVFETEEVQNFIKNEQINTTADKLLNFLSKIGSMVQSDKSDKLAENFYSIADKNAGHNSMKKMKEFLNNNIDSDNILDFLNSYDNEKIRKGDSSVIDTITSEIGAGGTKEQKEVLELILNKLIEAARKAKVSEKDIESAKNAFTTSMETELSATFRRTNPKDMEKALDFLRRAILAKQSSTENISEKEARELVANNFLSENSNAEASFKDAKNGVNGKGGWGWAAKAGDWICGLFGCNTIEELEEKLGDNAKYAKLLVLAAETGEIKDEETGEILKFNDIYKKLFGIDFDPEKIAAAENAKKEYNEMSKNGAGELASIIQNYDEIISTDIKEISYKKFVKLLKENLGWTDDIINQIVSNNKQGDPKEILLQYIKEAKNSMSAKLNELTNGKDFAQIQKNMNELSKAAYGTNDITKDVAQFNENMVLTDLAVSSVAEIAGTVALQFIPGVGQIAAAKLAKSAASWGAKGVKVIKYAQNAEKAFSKIATAQKAGSLATKAAISASGTAIATAGVNLSNKKEVKEVLRKTLMNASFSLVGTSSNVLAPHLMKALNINSQLATELAEEIINAAGSYTVTKAGGDDYTTSDAFMDLITGLAISRLSGVASPATKNSDINVKNNTEAPNIKQADNTNSQAYKTQKNIAETQNPAQQISSAQTKATTTLNQFETSLKGADLDNVDVQKSILQKLEEKYPSTRNVPGRVKTLKELQKLIASPEYAQMTEMQRQVAELTILRSNPRIDGRDILKDANIPTNTKRRISAIEKSLKKCDSGKIAAALYKNGDFETLIAIAKAQGVDENTIKQLTDSFNKAQKNGCLLVTNTKVDINKVPTKEITKNNKNYNIKVIDCTDPEVFKNPEKYGLPAGTTAENMRLSVHMNNDFNKNPRMTIGRLRQADDLNLSATITNGKNGLYDNQQVGIGLTYDMGAIGYASNYSAGTGFIKDIEALADAKLAFDTPSNTTFVRNKFIERMNAKGFNITIEDYAAFSKQFQAQQLSTQDLQALANNGMIDFNGKQIPLDIVQNTLSESTDDLINTTYELRGKTISNGMNEVNVANPDISYIYVRANSPDETLESILSPEMLEYIQQNNLTVIFQRHNI